MVSEVWFRVNEARSRLTSSLSTVLDVKRFGSAVGAVPLVLAYVGGFRMEIGFSRLHTTTPEQWYEMGRNTLRDSPLDECHVQAVRQSGPLREMEVEVEW